MMRKLKWKRVRAKEPIEKVTVDDEGDLDIIKLKGVKYWRLRKNLESKH